MKYFLNYAVMKTVCAVLLSSLLTVGVGAAPRVPRVVTDGTEYRGAVRLIDGTAYVKLREFSERLGAAVTWDAAGSTARVRTDSLDMTARAGEHYAVANGRYLWCRESVFIDGGSTFVPLRVIGKAFGYETRWDADTFTARLTRRTSGIADGGRFYDQSEVYWLSRIINAEAGGEPLLGKLAVGSVVLNRVKSPDFPDSVCGVVFDRAHGVQFTPTANGTVYNVPNDESVAAAKLCLEGTTVSEKVLFFLNADISESFWIVGNREYVMSVGNHDFYA